MNGTALRRSVARGNGTPYEFVWNTAIPEQNPGRTRGRSFVRGFKVQLAYALIDVALVCVIGFSVLWVRFGVSLLSGQGVTFFGRSIQHSYEGLFLLYGALIVMGCASQDLYRTPRDRSNLDEGLMVAKAVSLATMILVVFIFISSFKDVSRLVVISSGALNVAALTGWRLLKRRLILRRAAKGIGLSRVLIVGTSSTAQALSAWLNSNRQLGYDVCGHLDVQVPKDQRILGTVDDLRRIAITQFADELFISLPLEEQLVKKLAFEARRLRLGLKIFPDLYDGLGWRAPLHTIGGFPVMDLHWQPISREGLLVKRLLDVILSGFALFVAAPFLGLLVLCIRFDSPGPAIYSAERIGLKGKKFRCFKLRSMVTDADALKEKLRAANERNGPFFKIENDPRVTRLGRWLRRLSLDELPQLWNVLRGDMSLVGPRPHPLDDYQLYSIEHFRRLDVAPGLTGLWQVTARTDPSFERGMALDLEYIENWSLGLDLKIMLRTISALFRAEGR